MTECELVAGARAGSARAFTALVEIYQNPIYNLCYRMLGDPGEAEDAAQEAFLRAYSQLHRYDPGRPFKTWLFAIASHHCIDRLRKRRVTWLGIDDEPLLTHPALLEPRPGPEQMAVRREQEAVVQGALARLAPQDRSAIVMRYWYDMSYEEIAGAMGSTASAVKSRLHRARVCLAAVLRGAEGLRGAPSGASQAPQRNAEARWTAHATLAPTSA
jgi:RNA polymerase sigma-70 factor (ECF subfamily)